MKISYNWLNEYLTYGKIEIEEIASILTSTGLEVEGIEKFESIKGGLEKFFIGEVIQCERHPNADKLSLTEVNLGETIGILKIVCGAPNVAKGQKVVVATEGAMIYLPTGESFAIKKSKIRGEESNGMICAEDELSLGSGHDGILVLDNSAKVGTPAASFFNISSDYVLEIGLTPNRTDAMSHRGVARDLAAAMQARGMACEFFPNGKTSFAPAIKKSDKSFSIKINTDKSPKFGGVIIEDLTNTASPDWMKNRLKAIGESPKNLLIDITNYLLHDLGQPMHAYDLSKIDSTEIIISELNTNLEMVALNGNTLKLNAGDIVINDKSNLIGLGGVMGSKSSEIAPETKSIFLEAAYFDAKSIRITSQRLNLRSESAIKFEKGVDPNGTEYALEKARNILATICTDAKCSDIKMESTQTFDFWHVTMSKQKLDVYANMSMDISKVEAILVSLGIQIKSFDGEVWTLSVPRYKEDVKREEDVIEEVLRIFGYNQLPYPKYLKSNLSFSQGLSMTQFESKVSNLLVGSGFQEIITNSISQSRYFTHEQPIMLLNSMTSELDCMRTSIFPCVLEVVEHNLNRDNKDLNLFEIGNEYFLDKNGKYSQRKKLAILIAGLNEVQNWQKPKGAANDYFQIKSTIEKLALTLNLKLTYAESSNPQLNYGLDLILNQKTIGFIGEIKVDTKLFDIKQRVYGAEIDMDYIYSIAKKEKIIYSEVSKFPNVKRDLAMLIDETVPFSQIELVCKKSLSQSLIEVGLFDIFKDKSLGENRKSYAIRLMLQNKEKTMSDKEIDSMMQKLISNLKKEVNAEVRS